MGAMVRYNQKRGKSARPTINIRIKGNLCVAEDQDEHEQVMIIETLKKMTQDPKCKEQL